MTVEEIREVQEGMTGKEHKEYASKGVAGTGLGLGIAGTALGAWALFGRNRGILGGTPENININGVGGLGSTGAPTAFDAYSKACADEVALASAFYNGRINQLQERFADRQVIDSEMFGLYKSQIDADFMLYKGQRDQFDVLKAEIDGLKTKVAVGEAVRPYQDKLIMNEINDARKDARFDLWKRTCRMISGEVVLPETPTVTGFVSYNPCRVVESAPATQEA